MLLNDLVKAYQEERRMSVEKARIRVCQDQLMEKLMKSSYRESFTFKGGTVMYELSQNVRRSTMDVDVDAIGISISKDNLIRVFNEIGAVSADSGVSFHVDEDTIKELNHQSYKGKRLTLQFEDSGGDSLPLVLDIGVHTCLDVEQRHFLIRIEPSKALLKVYVNPPEQIVVEKTIDIVKKGILSTRMKDVFDVYFIISKGLVDKGKLTTTFSSMIQKSDSLRIRSMNTSFSMSMS